MQCENEQLEKTDPEGYELKMKWLDHAQREEFHQKHPQGNPYMYGYHKEQRLKLEKIMRHPALDKQLAT